MDDPGPRALLVALILGRLEWLQNTENVVPEQAANLIVDDIFSSGPMINIINRATTNGMDAGFEKALRDAIAAVGGLPRGDDQVNEHGEPQLILYKQAQAAIAQLSKRGLAELWKEGEPTNSRMG